MNETVTVVTTVEITGSGCTPSSFFPCGVPGAILGLILIITMVFSVIVAIDLKYSDKNSGEE